MAEGQAGTFHAVSVSSSFEPLVLKTIASLGGGSLRQISGERTPQQVALELLAELTQPVIRDLRVEFRGIRVARVYPPRLPNLAAGTQQILLGRYLPEGADQTGEIVVTGNFAGKPVRFSGKVALQDAEQGNSFIPRLWARMHLDALLDQGASPAIKDEIIALSEEYNIITPYTSLLVLESDADRERFKVQRRFQMRDGEKFFAEGRDQADFALIQQQMRLAGNWRLGLRRQVLSEWMGLGRDVPIAPVAQQAWAFGGGSFGGSGPYGGRYDLFRRCLRTRVRSGRCVVLGARGTGAIARRRTSMPASTTTAVSVTSTRSLPTRQPTATAPRSTHSKNKPPTRIFSRVTNR